MSGTEGLSEIGAAVAAPPPESATAMAASQDSALNLRDGEFAPSAMGTGLSECCAAVAAASRHSAAVTVPSRDGAVTAAASQDSVVVTAALCVIVLWLQQHC